MSARVQDQRLFGAYFAAATGLSPQVVGKWLAAEQGPGSSATPGSNNWLNIQYTDSGPNSTYFHIAHLDPRRAALASAQWLKQQSGLRGIIASAGKGVNAEAQAIENSGWASSHYNGGLAAVPGYSLPHVSEAAARTASVPGQQRVVPGSPEGGSTASAALIGQALAQLRSQPAQVPVGNVAAPAHSAAPILPNGAQPILGVAPAQPQDSTFARLLEAAGAAASSSGGEPHIASTGLQPQQTTHYVNPLEHFKLGRTDMGVDASAAPGTPIRAMGNGRVLGIQRNWFEGQPYVSYELTDGPRKGEVVYVAEQIIPHVHPGQQLTAGQRIGVYAPHGTGIETGIGTHSWQTKAQATTGYTEGQATPAGQQYRQQLASVGAH